MARPTRDDATLMIELAQLYEAQDSAEAAGWIRSDAFIPAYDAFYAKYPQGTPEAIKLNKLLGFYETLGTLHKHGLMSEDLLFDWLDVQSTFERVKDIVKGMQAAISPAMYENFEAMATAQQRWSDRRGQGLETVPMAASAEVAAAVQPEPPVVGPDEPHDPPPTKPERPPRARRPKEAEVHPSPKELGKEHRGY